MKKFIEKERIENQAIEAGMGATGRYWSDIYAYEVVRVISDKTIEIRSSTEIITTYQSLGEISVKKGDTVTQGQIIGKSGTCTLNSDVANGLHFEMYKNGQVINPEKFYDKSLKDLESN